MNELQILSELDYRPQTPKKYRPNIGLIGCGGITRYHLQAYVDAGFQVTGLCDLDRSRAELRRLTFYPEAKVFDDYRQLLKDDLIEVVDITTHPPERPPIIRAALSAGKHVLSQKPFVLDVRDGHRLIEIADKHGKQLAVNQNGRWAPHFSYARQVVASHLIGDVFGAHLSCHWDHTWVQGTEFEKVKHLILYDYAIHWFDIVRCLLKDAPILRVFASTARVPGQSLMPDLLGQALIEFEGAQATLAFDAALPFGTQERTFLSGTRGSLSSVGSGNQQQSLTVSTESGDWVPRLVGKWFPDGFHGTMGELLCAIEDGRQSSINAEDNLKSLELCFAAIASAESGRPVVPGSVTSLPGWL
jgi:predicted dehydrogenase